ncbi:MAG: hypothetical protein IT291_05670 [Deltaproteobacteria bacterium]|nr:hypothetical protein [Deltaproteobacteria bacterium]
MQQTAGHSCVSNGRAKRAVDPDMRREALRTAFVSRFIVLREGRRSRAHRDIEQFSWDNDTTAHALYARIREAFLSNGDKIEPVDRDLRRALEHAERSVDYFLNQYIERNVLSFMDALMDYERSNRLLFGDDPSEVPRTGGWRLPSGKAKCSK